MKKMQTINVDIFFILIIILGYQRITHKKNIKNVKAINVYRMYICVTCCNFYLRSVFIVESYFKIVFRC